MGWHLMFRCLFEVLDSRIAEESAAAGIEGAKTRYSTVWWRKVGRPRSDLSAIQAWLPLLHSHQTATSQQYEAQSGYRIKLQDQCYGPARVRTGHTIKPCRHRAKQAAVAIGVSAWCFVSRAMACAWRPTWGLIIDINSHSTLPWFNHQHMMFAKPSLEDGSRDRKLSPGWFSLLTWI